MSSQTLANPCKPGKQPLYYDADVFINIGVFSSLLAAMEGYFCCIPLRWTFFGKKQNDMEGLSLAFRLGFLFSTLLTICWFCQNCCQCALETDYYKLNTLNKHVEYSSLNELKHNLILIRVSNNIMIMTIKLCSYKRI